MIEGGRQKGDIEIGGGELGKGGMKYLKIGISKQVPAASTVSWIVIIRACICSYMGHTPLFPGSV